MTYIDNFASIIENGLLSHNEAYRRGLIEADISDPNVQDIRAGTVDPFYNRPLHEYVPLYFSPRNPMLYRRREIQEDIVILGLDPLLLSEPDIIFTDGNAAANGTFFYTGTSMLDRLPWNSIRARNWTDIEDGKRIKCAEVLVHPQIEASRSNSVSMQLEEIPEVRISESQTDGLPEYDNLFYVVLPSIEKALSIAQTKDEIVKGFDQPKKTIDNWLKKAEELGKVKKLPGRPVRYIATASAQAKQLECSFIV